MKKNYLISLLFVLPIYVFSQEYTLSGSVLNTDNLPIPFANVVLLNENSQPIKWDYADDDGNYTIQNIKPQTYTLKVSSLGYQANSTPIEINQDILNYTITLKPQEALDEVVVTATQPKIERKVDRLIFNVENSTLSDSDVWNVLTKTPYLVQTGNEILVKGRETPLIFINDKRVYLTSSELQNLLESTPANTLKSVEVILTPPAKYDAEGGTIVNIVMKKNLITGYNGNISTRYEQGFYPKFRFSTGHFYKTDKINLYAAYTRNIRRRYGFFRDNITFFTDENPSGNWISETKEDMNRNNHNINTNIDYDINNNHALQLAIYTAFISNQKGIRSSQTDAYNDLQQIDSSFYSENRGLYTRNNIAVNLDYIYKLNKRQKLTTNLHHTNYNYNYDQIITTEYSDADEIVIRNNSFTNDKEQDVQIYTAQLDFTNKINKNNFFESGIKWSHITFDNQIDQVNIEGENPDLFDLFFYDETNLSAYLSYEKNWDTWDVKLGLRGENTQLKGVSVSESETNEQNYFKLFPSIHLAYKPKDNHKFTLSYVKKISRPRFSKLNPFQQFFNDNSYVTGNPDLLPTINHKFNFVYTFKRSLSFDLYFTQSNNEILQLPYVDNENNLLIYTQDNLDKSVEYGIDINYSKEIKPWWYFSTFFSIYYDENRFFDFQDDTQLFKNSKWVNYYQLSNDFNLSKDKTFKGDISFRYISQSPTGNNITGQRSTVDIGLQKKLWNKRATLSFYANDIFNKLSFTTTARYLDQNIRSFSNFEYRTFEFRFTYKFGNYKLRTNKKGIYKEERDRL